MCRVERSPGLNSVVAPRLFELNIIDESLRRDFAHTLGRTNKLVDRQLVNTSPCHSVFLIPIGRPHEALDEAPKTDSAISAFDLRAIRDRRLRFLIRQFCQFSDAQ